MHGSQKDLLPGEPNLAPSSAVIVESYVTLIRKLHASNTWTEEVKLEILLYCKAYFLFFQVNYCILNSLNKISEYFPENNQKIEGAASIDCIDTSSQLDTDSLCKLVWPALAIMGGRFIFVV